MNNGSSSLGFGRLFGYSVGQIAGQVFRDVPSVLLLLFLTNVIGINPAIAGISIFVPKLFVGLAADMTVGYLSERNPGRWPRWILAGALLTPIAMFFLFRVPEAAQQTQIAYVVAIFSFYMAVFGIFSVPYLAIASRLANSIRESTKLMAWRMGFTAIGVIVASGFAPWFLSQNGSLSPETALGAYQALGMVLAVLCFSALMIAFWSVRGAPAFKHGAKTETGSRLMSPGAVIRAFRSRRFLPLVSANLVQLTGAGMSYAAFLYFLIYNMQVANPFAYIPKLIVLSCLGIIAAQPVWVYLAGQFGKKPMFLTASFLHGGVMIFWALSAGVSEDFSLLLAFLLGVGNSGWAMLGFSMVTDLSAEGDGGIYSAGWIAVDKIGFALGGTLLIGLILNGFGFDSALAMAGGQQPPSAISGIMVAFGIIPGTLYILGGLVFGIWGKETALTP